MTTHKFVLVLSKVPELSSELADALYEATDGDVELSMRDCVPYLEFERSASSLQAAVDSAIRDVKEANLGIRVVRVESETANTIARINASLLGAISDA